MNSMRRTKIVCTLGPASSDAGTIRRLVEAGMDVARLNFSHGAPEAHAAVMRLVREAASEAGRVVAILQDLPGPKIRTGRGEPVELVPGGEVTILPGSETTEAGRIGCTYADLGRDVSPGDMILLADGTFELEVIDSSKDAVRCRVVRGGLLLERKGVNLPGVDLTARAPTEEDLRFLSWGLDNGVDYIALSFVRSADDMRRARETAGARAGEVAFVAKIERPEAVDDLDDVLDVADAIMVARGDLGVELAPERVPNLQREIIRRANAADKPVITATQMLESMTEHSRPTRAEVSDVAHAIWDGTDAVMLSGETASGRYPVETAALMARIAVEAEREMGACGSGAAPSKPTGAQDVIGMAAELLARELGAAAVAAFTMSGRTARYVSMARPRCPIMGLSPSDAALRRMALLRGVVPRGIGAVRDAASLAEQARRSAADAGIASAGDLVVLVYGEPVGSGALANTVRLEVV